MFCLLFVIESAVHSRDGPSVQRPPGKDSHRAASRSIDTIYVTARMEWPIPAGSAGRLSGEGAVTLRPTRAGLGQCPRGSGFSAGP